MADPQTSSGPAEGWTWTDTKAETQPTTGPQIGPAYKNTALPPESMGYRDPLGPEARKKLTTPLADTGIGLVDDLTTPANIVGALVVGGMAAKEAQAAGSVASRALAGMKGVVSSAAPAIKYEIIKTALSAARVPPSIAMGTALIMSGYQKGGAKPIAESVAAKPVAAEVPVVAKPVKSSPVAEAPIEVAPAAKAPAPSASPEFETGGSSHGPTNQYYNSRKYDTTFASDAQDAAGKAKGRAMRAFAANKAAESQSAAEALAAKFGTPSDLDTVKSLVAKGNSAASAVKAVAGGDAKKFGALMTAYMQSRQVKP